MMSIKILNKGNLVSIKGIALTQEKECVLVFLTSVLKNWYERSNYSNY